MDFKLATVGTVFFVPLLGYLVDPSSIMRTPPHFVCLPNVSFHSFCVTHPPTLFCLCWYPTALYLPQTIHFFRTPLPNCHFPCGLVCLVLKPRLYFKITSLDANFLFPLRKVLPLIHPSWFITSVRVDNPENALFKACWLGLQPDLSLSFTLLLA